MFSVGWWSSFRNQMEKSITSQNNLSSKYIPYLIAYQMYFFKKKKKKWYNQMYFLILKFLYQLNVKMRPSPTFSQYLAITTIDVVWFLSLSYWNKAFPNEIEAYFLLTYICHPPGFVNMKEKKKSKTVWNYCFLLFSTCWLKFLITEKTFSGVSTETYLAKK